MVDQGRLQRTLRRTSWALAAAALAYLVARFDLAALPEGSCSPLLRFGDGADLLVDRWPGGYTAGDAVFFRGGDELLYMALVERTRSGRGGPRRRRALVARDGQCRPVPGVRPTSSGGSTPRAAPAASSSPGRGEGPGPVTWSEARLHRWLNRRARPTRALGSPGHDAAVLARPAGRLVTCADATIEGVHYDRGTAPAKVGRKAAARALSDLAATAATPLDIVLVLSAPPTVREAWIRAAIDALDGTARGGGRGTGRRRPRVRAGPHDPGGDRDRGAARSARAGGAGPRVRRGDRAPHRTGGGQPRRTTPGDRAAPRRGPPPVGARGARDDGHLRRPRARPRPPGSSFRRAGRVGARSRARAHGRPACRAPLRAAGPRARARRRRGPRAPRHPPGHGRPPGLGARPGVLSRLDRDRQDRGGPRPRSRARGPEPALGAPSATGEDGSTAPAERPIP